MYTYKPLNDVSYEQIVNCFNLAFSDYYLPVEFSVEKFQDFLKINGVDKELSYGAFLNGEMVGFIFNSSNSYNNYKSVFDVVTGIVPEHRGKSVFSNLFSFTEQNLKKRQIEKYYLEVLQQNHKAIYLYKKQGFTITREFSVLASSNHDNKTNNSAIEYIEFSDFDWNSISHCQLVKPSYEHSTNILKLNPNYYSVVCRYKNHILSAFCIFFKQNGNIVQLGYTDIDDLKLIVKQLLSKFNNITVKNIDLIHSDVLEMLNSIDFKEVAKQFEMVKTIYDK